MLVRHQIFLTGLIPDRLKKPGGDFTVEQTVAIFGKRGMIPDRIIHGQTDKPAKQQIVMQFFHQQPFASDRIENLQQQGSQPLLRRNGWPTVGEISLGEPAMHVLQGLIHHIFESGEAGGLWEPAARGKCS